jgi:hypothetical protein
MNRWMPKKRIMYLTIGVTASLCAIYLLSFYFVNRNINKIADSYKNSDSESSKTERVWMIKALVESNKEYIEKTRQFFISKDGEVEFIKQIESIAKNSLVDFSIKSIDVLPNSGQNFFDDVKVSINFEGNWVQVTTFVNSLENMKVGTKTKSLTLESNAKDLWRGSIEFISHKEK